MRLGSNGVVVLPFRAPARRRFRIRLVSPRLKESISERHWKLWFGRFSDEELIARWEQR
jgi:hypothetical protein